MMDPSNPQFLQVSRPGESARRIAYRLQRNGSGDRPALVWFPGFLSDMASTKAEALAGFARKRGLGLLRFDYSGHGLSSGRACDGTIGGWLEECEAMLGLIEGRVILIGSSMGAWLALLALRNFDPDAKAAGAVLIAPAWDMTEALMWRQFSPEIRAQIERDGIYRQPSAYNPDGYPISKALIEEGRGHLIENAPFDPGCPIRILHGMCDPDVPFGRSLELLGLLTSEDVTLTLVKDADHRLSRPRDIDRLLSAVDELVTYASFANAVMPSR